MHPACRSTPSDALRPRTRNACSKSLELPIALSQRFGQFPRIPALLRTSLRPEVFPCIQLFVERGAGHARRHLQFPDKLLSLHHKGPLCLRHGDNLTIGTHHRAGGPEFCSQTLNHLIGFFPSSREDNLKAQPMLPLFGAPSLLPPVKDHRDRMGFSLAIRRQVSQERLARHLGMQARPCTDPTRQSQEIVPIDDQVECHDPRPYRSQDSLSIGFPACSYTNPLDNCANI